MDQGSVDKYAIKTNMENVESINPDSGIGSSDDESYSLSEDFFEFAFISSASKDEFGATPVVGNLYVLVAQLFLIGSKGH